MKPVKEQAKDVVNCLQDADNLKTMEWAEDMVWILDSASQVLSSRGYSVTTELLGEVECAWRAGYHVVFTKTANYFKALAASPLDDEQCIYESWPVLKKSIFTRIAAKSIEVVKRRRCVVCVCAVHFACVHKCVLTMLI